MAAFRVSGQIGNVKDLIDQLQARKRKVGPILRRAVTKGAQRLVKAMKGRVPVESGLLKKSLGYKIGISRKTGAVYAVIGPRTGFKRAVVLLDGRGALAGSKAGQRLKSKGGEETIRNPTRYAHLAERKHGWMKAAISQDGPAAMDDIRQVIESELLK